MLNLCWFNSSTSSSSFSFQMETFPWLYGSQNKPIEHLFHVLHGKWSGCILKNWERKKHKRSSLDIYIYAVTRSSSKGKEIRSKITTLDLTTNSNKNFILKFVCVQRSFFSSFSLFFLFFFIFFINSKCWTKNFLCIHTQNTFKGVSTISICTYFHDVHSKQNIKKKKKQQHTNRIFTAIELLFAYILCERSSLDTPARAFSHPYHISFYSISHLIVVVAFHFSHFISYQFRCCCCWCSCCYCIFSPAFWYSSLKLYVCICV